MTGGGGKTSIDVGVENSGNSKDYAGGGRASIVGYSSMSADVIKAVRMDGAAGTAGGAGTFYHRKQGEATGHLVVRSTFLAKHDTPVNTQVDFTTVLVENVRLVMATEGDVKVATMTITASSKVVITTSKLTVGTSLTVPTAASLHVVGGSLEVAGDLTLAAGGSTKLDVDGMLVVRDDLNVQASASATVGDAVVVDGDAVVAGTLDVKGEAMLSSFRSDQGIEADTSFFRGALLLDRSSARVSVKHAVDVAGNVSLAASTTLSTDGILAVHTDFTIGASASTTVGDALVVDGDALVTGTLLVKGQEMLSSFRSGLGIATDTTFFRGTLTMASSSASVTVKHTVDVAKSTTLRGATTVSGALRVKKGGFQLSSGTLTLSKDMDVTGSVELGASSTLTISGGHLDVSGDVVAVSGATLRVGGSSSQRSYLLAGGKVEFPTGSSLTVYDDITVKESASVGSSFSCPRGNVRVENTLVWDVSGSTVVSKDVSVGRLVLGEKRSSTLTVQGDLHSAGDTTVGKDGNGWQNGVTVHGVWVVGGDLLIRQRTTITTKSLWNTTKDCVVGSSTTVTTSGLWRVGKLLQIGGQVTMVGGMAAEEIQLLEGSDVTVKGGVIDSGSKLTIGGKLTHAITNLKTKAIRLLSKGSLHVTSTGHVDADLKSSTKHATFPYLVTGASHGGVAFDGCVSCANPVFGSFSDPTEFGVGSTQCTNTETNSYTCGYTWLRDSNRATMTSGTTYGKMRIGHTGGNGYLWYQDACKEYMGFCQAVPSGAQNGGGLVMIRAGSLVLDGKITARGRYVWRWGLCAMWGARGAHLLCCLHRSS